MLSKKSYLSSIRKRRKNRIIRKLPKNLLEKAKAQVQRNAVSSRKIIFTVEKFILEDMDRLQNYWHEMRTSPGIFSNQKKQCCSIPIMHKENIDMIGKSSRIEGKY